MVPPSAVTVLASASTVTFRISERSITRPSSIAEEPEVECPPPRTTKGMLFLRMKFRVAEMSEEEVGFTTPFCSLISKTPIYDIIFLFAPIFKQPALLQRELITCDSQNGS
jgi:hypothetical protein